MTERFPTEGFTTDRPSAADAPAPALSRRRWRPVIVALPLVLIAAGLAAGAVAMLLAVPFALSGGPAAAQAPQPPVTPAPPAA
ncbi:hypothetical protein CH338_28965, partial [Rhodoplanes elegans]